MLGLFVVLLLALLVLSVCALVATIFWRAGRWGIAAMAVLALVIGWAVFRAAEPEPQFYVDLFERETGLAFPASGEFMDRGAMVPDNTGDYCASALIAIAPQDAERLRVALRKARAEPTPSSRLLCEDVRAGARGPYLATKRDHKDGRWIWWGVSEDGRTLAFTYEQL